MHRMGHHPKQTRAIERLQVQHDHRFPGALRLQQPLLPLTPQRPQQKHPPVGHDHHIAAAGLDTAVDHEQVAVVDAVAAQPMAADPHVEAADRFGHQGRV
jgi:hypothetical protein